VEESGWRSLGGGVWVGRCAWCGELDGVRLK